MTPLRECYQKCEAKKAEFSKYNIPFGFTCISEGFRWDLYTIKKGNIWYPFDAAGVNLNAMNGYSFFYLSTIFYFNQR